MSSESRVVLPPLPTYECLQAPRAPVLDGSLSDPVWELATPVTLVECVTAGPAAQKTRVRLLWHGEYLYLGAEIDEWNIQDHNTQHNDPVFSEACVELFLAAPAGFPERNHGVWRYLEFDTAPGGIFWDGRVDNPRRENAPPSEGQRITIDESYYPPDLLALTTIDGTANDASDRDRGWKLELQVPFTGPPGGSPPQPGDVWRANFYRIHGWGQPDQELQAWSAVGVLNFHMPYRFGYLKFAGPSA